MAAKRLTGRARFGSEPGDHGMTATVTAATYGCGYGIGHRAVGSFSVTHRHGDGEVVAVALLPPTSSQSLESR